MKIINYGADFFHYKFGKIFSKLNKKITVTRNFRNINIEFHKNKMKIQLIAIIFVLKAFLLSQTECLYSDSYSYGNKIYCASDRQCKRINALFTCVNNFCEMGNKGTCTDRMCFQIAPQYKCIDGSCVFMP